jgi:hypothetical protein
MTPTRPVDFCLHALHRMREMGLSRSIVARVVADPDISYPGRPAPTGEPRRIAVRGPLAVVYVPRTRTVVTVLWNGRTARHAA